MNPTGPARLVCFISGGGRTVLNIQDVIDKGELNAAIALVVANRECPGITRCQQRRLETKVIPGSIDAATLDTLLRGYRASLACLAGYLKLLPVPAAWQGRILNIHPSLLPKFGGPGMYGTRVHQAVIDAGETESGCTVHLCDNRYDTGPIVLQKACPVLPEDTADSLAGRVFEQECQAYPEAIRTVLTKLESEAKE